MKNFLSNQKQNYINVIAAQYEHCATKTREVIPHNVGLADSGFKVKIVITPYSSVVGVTLNFDLKIHVKL